MSDKHKHKLELFIEKGCTDNKVFKVCKCGYYREVDTSRVVKKAIKDIQEGISSYKLLGEP